MLTGARRRAASAVVGVGLGVSAATGSPGPAAASTDEAVNACGAYVIDKETAVVPEKNRSGEFVEVNTMSGSFRVLCGDGDTYGAVHIEVKHEVPSWAEATACITKRINRGRETSEGTFQWTFSGGSVVVVTGGPGIVTAYPTGDDVAAKWRRCAAV